MDLDDLGPEARKSLEEILGYLNFSSGSEDLRFLAGINSLFGRIEASLPREAVEHHGPAAGEPAWRALGRLIRTGLDQLRHRFEAFQKADQAEAVVRLVFDGLLPAYRRHHRDLLFHQTDESLFRPFFIGRACEAVLSEGGPWHEPDRILSGALKRLNDFIGHRPVAVLETGQKLQPYGHEWVRPIPLYIAGAGVAAGRYHDLIDKMLEILRATDEELLEQAWLDPDRLDELALDPRAFDFDHPVNRRPNHHFGGWDPHHIDNRGFYRRFVLQQVTLDALSSRADQPGDLPRDELLFEAAAVLACTMMMGSGITGSGPDSHDSSTTLATLLPIIAGYRDEFYQRLLARISGRHAERLNTEAASLRQPFGGARQHLNQALARRRAEQLQHVHLARLFARMGYTEAAARQARVVPVASARMRCEIDCRLTTAHLEADRGRLDAAAALVPEIEDLLHRAIECGALADPWNILGFGAQFSLFPAVENSVHDHRIDELIELVSGVFGLYARLQKEAAAAGRTDLQKQLADGLGALARWWDPFASTEVSSVEGVSGRESWQSADQVAGAIAAWHQAGTAAGDIAFWREHVEQFHSPKAFALLAETLIEQQDLVASMALLMLWLSRAESLPLAEGEYSFHVLAVRWMEDLWREGQPAKPAAASPRRAVRPDDRWPLCRKFFDYLEANAEEYWDVPRLELLGASAPEDHHDEGEEVEEDSSEGLFSAAYENVTYRDTTDDGFEGEMIEGGPPTTDFELSLEAERISRRLAMLTTVARLWKLASAASAACSAEPSDRHEVLAGWLAKAADNRQKLLGLLAAVHRYRIPPPRSTLDAMIEYDRRRGIKEVLLDRIVATCVETADAGRLIVALLGRQAPDAGLDDWEVAAWQVLQAMFRGDRRAVRAGWPELLETLRRQPLLYRPTSRGGNPQRVFASRSLQQVLRRLLEYAPRLGLLSETYRLIETIHEMEQSHPAGPGAITEFDRLFEIGCGGIVECLVASSDGWPAPPAGPAEDNLSDLQLVGCLERVAERLLQCWLEHSRNIRISVLDTVADQRRWQQLKKFIRHYGGDLFTQRFMNFGNLRAILQEGVEAYLDSLDEQSAGEDRPRLLEDLNGRLPRRQAARCLELTIEAVVENYPEYIDYNSTTTQSDRGEMLYTLLDFLRIQASYDRVAWNLKPVIIAHEVLVRRGRSGAADIWERAVAQRTAEVADQHLDRFEQMAKKYGMRLPSIADRLGERFVRPLAVDRLRALLRPALEEMRSGGPLESFARLEQEIARFTQKPGGVGFEVPPWLEALENEVEELQAPAAEAVEPADPAPPVPQVRLSLEEVQGELESWDEEDS